MFHLHTQTSMGRPIVLALCALLLLSSGAHGQTLGGFMSHVNIGVSGGQVLVFKDDPSIVPNMIGPDAFDAPFSVLNGKGYNAQFGWTALFPFDLQGDLIWIELLDQTPGLQSFQGGFASNAGGTGLPDPGDQPMAPIFGTFGSPNIWNWSGSMTHNWYAATEPGDYSATYQVYVGDSLGVTNNAYTPAQVTFEFTNTHQQLLGDLNTDGFVGIDDLNTVLGNWNQNTQQGDPLTGDPSGDGFVGIDDLNTVLGNWNAGTPPPLVASIVPEPGSMLVLLFIGWLTLGRRGKYEA